jgi:hypothetical protein
MFVYLTSMFWDGTPDSMLPRDRGDPQRRTRGARGLRMLTS